MIYVNYVKVKQLLVILNQQWNFDSQRIYTFIVILQKEKRMFYFRLIFLIIDFSYLFNVNCILLHKDINWKIKTYYRI